MRVLVVDDHPAFRKALASALRLIGAIEIAGEGHLGLRLIQDLVRDAGGTVSVDSTGGEGTTVRIEVPR